MRKLISYLVPSYNHEPYVIELLDSIKNDAECFSSAAEVVIFDDGSSDRSVELIQAWEKNNKGVVDIICSYSPKNGGIPYAFNRLIDMSSGEFVRFCGTDDIITCGSTKQMLANFTGKPDLVCIFGDAVVIDQEGKVLHPSSIDYHGANRKILEDQRQIRKELIRHWCIAGPCMVIRRSHYETMRYDETLKIDDFDLILSLLEKDGAVVFLNEIVACYRTHSSNTSKTRDISKRIRNLESFLAIIDRYIERRILKTLLLPLRYKTMAKLDFLRRKYALCSVHLLQSQYFSIRLNGKE